MNVTFNLGSLDKNINSAIEAIDVLNSQYGYPNDSGTKTYAVPRIHPDGEQVAITLNNKGDEDLITQFGGENIETLTDDWFTDPASDKTEEKPVTEKQIEDAKESEDPE